MKMLKILKFLKEIPLCFIYISNSFFQVPGKPNVNKKHCKWRNESVKKTVNAVMNRSLPIREASQLFCEPLATLQNQVAESEFLCWIKY